MSNYKPRIETNNLDLTSILSTINELPDAGPSVETCTLTMSIQSPSVSPTALVCILADGSFIDKNFGGGSTYVYTLPKPCVIGLPNNNFVNISGNYENAASGIYFIYGDTTVEGYYEDMGGGPA